MLRLEIISGVSRKLAGGYLITLLAITTAAEIADYGRFTITEAPVFWPALSVYLVTALISIILAVLR
jgi:hypothetical protein